MSVADYIALASPHWQTKPRFMDWLSTLLSLGVMNQSCLENIIPSYNLNTAVGPQLDIIGKILELPREVDFNFSDGVTSSVLSDDDYRIILKCRLVKMFWNGTLDSFKSLWDSLVGVLLPLYIVDHSDMAPIAVVWDESLQSKYIDLIAHGYIVPNPAGLQVLTRAVYVGQTFGFDGMTGIQPFTQGVFYNLENNQDIQGS